MAGSQRAIKHFENVWCDQINDLFHDSRWYRISSWRLVGLSSNSGEKVKKRAGRLWLNIGGGAPPVLDRTFSTLSAKYQLRVPTSVAELADKRPRWHGLTKHPLTSIISLDLLDQHQFSGAKNPCFYDDAAGGIQTTLLVPRLLRRHGRSSCCIWTRRGTRFSSCRSDLATCGSIYARLSWRLKRFASRHSLSK